METMRFRLIFGKSFSKKGESTQFSRRHIVVALQLLHQQLINKGGGRLRRYKALKNSSMIKPSARDDQIMLYSKLLTGGEKP